MVCINPDILLINIAQNLSLAEDFDLYLDILFINQIEVISIDDIHSSYLDILNFDESDSISISEYIFFLDLVIELGIIADSVLILETISAVKIYLTYSYDAVSIAELVTLYMSISFSSSEEILVIERVFILDIIIELFAIDAVVSVDRGFIFRVENFSEFLRGYPFVEITEAEIDKIEFENGIVQMIDRWGRTRKTFQIILPVSTKSEAMPVKEFYERNIGRRFYFTNPVDHKTYNVTFLDNSYRLERSHYDTYEAEVGLVEVF